MLFFGEIFCQVIWYHKIEKKTHTHTHTHTHTLMWCSPLSQILDVEKYSTTTPIFEMFKKHLFACPKWVNLIFRVERGQRSVPKMFPSGPPMFPKFPIAPHYLSHSIWPWLTSMYITCKKGSEGFVWQNILLFFGREASYLGFYVGECPHVPKILRMGAIKWLLMKKQRKKLWAYPSQINSSMNKVRCS